MSTNTRLEPLTPERARELVGLMRQVGSDGTRALALDDRGRVLGVVGADDEQQTHLLGDLDVHA
jgi:hypothetical protein